MSRIGIVGSRNRDTDADFELVKSALQKIYTPLDVIISGGCKFGGDRFAINLALMFELDYIEYPPDKSSFKPPLQHWMFTKANYDRNTLIAHGSDVLIACVSADRKGGTEDTIKKFIKHWKGTKQLILV